jgi:hypothetical protein
MIFSSEYPSSKTRQLQLTRPEPPTIKSEYPFILMLPMAERDGPRLGLGVSPVIQIYNILNIVDLLEYVEEVSEGSGREIFVDFLFCFHPDFMVYTRTLDLERRQNFANSLPDLAYLLKEAGYTGEEFQGLQETAQPLSAL